MCVCSVGPAIEKHKMLIEPEPLPLEWRTPLRILNGDCRYNHDQIEALRTYLGLVARSGFHTLPDNLSVQLWDELRDMRSLAGNGFVQRKMELSELRQAVTVVFSGSKTLPERLMNDDVLKPIALILSSLYIYDAVNPRSPVQELVRLRGRTSHYTGSDLECILEG